MKLGDILWFVNLAAIIVVGVSLHFHLGSLRKDIDVSIQDSEADVLSTLDTAFNTVAERAAAASAKAVADALAGAGHTQAELDAATEAGKAAGEAEGVAALNDIKARIGVDQDAAFPPVQAVPTP